MTTFLLRTILLGCFSLFLQTTQAQDKQALELEIEQHEQEIAALERSITQNTTAGNTSPNGALQQEIDNHEQEIDRLLQQMKHLGQGGGSANCEQEILAVRKEVEAAEAIVSQLEAEILDLQKEIQRLTIEGGGAAEIDPLRKKVANQKAEISALKGQIRGYQKMAKNNPASPSNTSQGQINQLQAEIRRLEQDNVLLEQRLNNRRSMTSNNSHRFQQQYISENATSFIIGYRYTLMPRINYQEVVVLYQNALPVGTMLTTPQQQTAGHNGYVGIERLWHGYTIGGNIGIAGQYAYQAQPELSYQMIGGALGGELTVLPLRLGLRVSGAAGYLWGQFTNHDLRLENSRLERDPIFSAAYLGWEAKLRVYISRMVAFTGSIGADHPIRMVTTPNFEIHGETWGTSLKFGLGLDVLLKVSR